MPRRITRFARSDGMGLLILAGSDIGRGISFLPISWWAYRGSGHPAEQWMPLTCWAVIWIGVGLISAGVAFHWRDTRAAVLAWAACIGLHVLWGVSFLSYDLIGDTSRGWVSALNYFVVSAFGIWSVWRGSSHEVKIKGERV